MIVRIFLMTICAYFHYLDSTSFTYEVKILWSMVRPPQRKSILERGQNGMKNLNTLEQERSALLNEWIRAKEAEKVKLLIKIMDIDEQLAVDKDNCEN